MSPLLPVIVDYWTLILTIFKWINEFPKQLGLERQMKKMRSFVWFSCLLSELWSLNCQIVYFLHFFADVRPLNLRPLYASESSRFAPLENIIDYYAMT